MEATGPAAAAGACHAQGEGFSSICSAVKGRHQPLCTNGAPCRPAAAALCLHKPDLRSAAVLQAPWLWVSSGCSQGIGVQSVDWTPAKGAYLKSLCFCLLYRTAHAKFYLPVPCPSGSVFLPSTGKNKR
jgi:hypothetical protein